MQNITADCCIIKVNIPGLFSVCTAVAIFVLSSVTVQKNQQYDVVWFIICDQLTVCSVLPVSSVQQFVCNRCG